MAPDRGSPGSSGLALAASPSDHEAQNSSSSRLDAGRKRMRAYPRLTPILPTHMKHTVKRHRLLRQFGSGLFSYLVYGGVIPVAVLHQIQALFVRQKQSCRLAHQ